MKIKCPGCNTLLQIPESAAGKVVKCKCGKQLRAPAAKGAAAAPRPAAPQAPANPAAAPMQGQPQMQRRVAAPAPTAPGIFDELTETDLSGVKAVQVPGQEQRKAPSASAQKALASATHDYKQDKAASHKSYLEGAKKEIMTSLGIYIGLGAIQAIFGVIFLMGIEKEAEYLALQDDSGLELSVVLTALRAGYVLKVCLGVVFFVASATFMFLPMTSAITAMVTFILAEIVGMILNPFSIVNIRAWIWRFVVFGGLLQAINNASYYRFVLSGGREKDARTAEKMKSANKLNAKSVTVMAGGIAVILATFSLGGYYVVEASKRPVDPTASARTENGREVPAGFQLYETNGVSIFLPRGVTIDTARSAMDYKAIVTGMGTVFMMGVGEVDGGPLDVGALDAQIEKWVIGEYTQGPSTERNGYSGVRGSISGSMHFAPRENTRAPMMNVEVYQDDGRVIIIGVAQDQNRSGNVIIGQSAEPEVEREFYQSLQIGPKPVGGGGGFFF